MTEQHLGLLILAIGIYFVVCSTKARDFPLYRMKAQRAASLIGENAAHGFYLILGLFMLVAGLLKAFGIWGPPHAP